MVHAGKTVSRPQEPGTRGSPSDASANMDQAANRRRSHDDGAIHTSILPTFLASSASSGPFGMGWFRSPCEHRQSFLVPCTDFFPPVRACSPIFSSRADRVPPAASSDCSATTRDIDRGRGHEGTMGSCDGPVTLPVRDRCADLSQTACVHGPPDPHDPGRPSSSQDGRVRGRQRSQRPVAAHETRGGMQEMRGSMGR